MNVTRDNYEAYALDYLEGALISPDKQSFEKFLDDNPDIKEELLGFSIVEVKPDYSVVYEKKSSLYNREKKAVIIPLWSKFRSIAAVAVLLIASSVIFFLLKNNSNENVLQVADNTKGVMEHSESEQNNTFEGNDKGVLEDNNPENIVSDDRDDNVPRENKESKKERQFVNKQPADIAEVSNEPLDLEPEQKEGGPAKIDEINRSIETEEIKEYRTQLAKIETVPSLPRHEWLAAAKVDLTKKKLIVIQESSDETEIEIHIPGEFLSETWSDISFTQFKEKLIPEFLRTE